MKIHRFKYLISVLAVAYIFAGASIAEDTKEPDFVAAADAFQNGNYVDAAIRFRNLAENNNLDPELIKNIKNIK